MPKVKYNGITFDSELEVDYYKYLVELEHKDKDVSFEYHPVEPIHLNSKNRYFPDFIVCYSDRIEIVECKGYSQYSYIKDNYIHQTMLEKSESDLCDYVMKNGWVVAERKVVYKKIKYLKAFGFVDWDFKNPNTAINKAREKRKELESEIKELRTFKKNTERYFSYQKKLRQGLKLTKPQQEWLTSYESEWLE